MQIIFTISAPCINSAELDHCCYGGMPVPRFIFGNGNRLCWERDDVINFKCLRESMQISNLVGCSFCDSRKLCDSKVNKGFEGRVMASARLDLRNNDTVVK